MRFASQPPGGNQVDNLLLGPSYQYCYYCHPAYHYKYRFTYKRTKLSKGANIILVVSY